MGLGKRIIIDTNFIVNVCLSNDFSFRKLFVEIIDSNAVLLSQAVFDEMVSVLSRKKFNKACSLEYREDLLRNIVERSIIIPITSDVQDCRDWKDDKFLNLAIDGDADFIITGDQDLLTLNPYKNIQILTAKQFLEIEYKEERLTA